MISDPLVTYVIASAAYGVSTAVGVGLHERVRVPMAAALAPPLAVTALEVRGELSTAILLGPLFALITLVIARRSTMEIGSHLTLSVAVLGMVLAFGAAFHSVPLLLVMSLTLTLFYSVADLLRQRVSSPVRDDIRSVRQALCLVEAVLLSACGLTVLVVARMGWPAFLVMAAVLALTKREFEAFGDSRKAYVQTVRALDRLSALAGRDR